MTNWEPSEHSGDVGLVCEITLLIALVVVLLLFFLGYS